MILEIKRSNKSFESKEIVVKKQFTSDIINVYQNDDNIKNIIMEAASKNNNQSETIGSVGCRYVAGIREIMKYIPITVKEIDDLADEGTWKDDCWVDSSTTIANVIDFNKLVNKINKKYNTNLKYLRSTTWDKQNQFRVIDMINKNVAPILKMPNLVTPNWNHFINAKGYIIDSNDKLYLQMAETYKNYNGYNDYWIEYYNVIAYEFIYI